MSETANKSALHNPNQEEQKNNASHDSDIPTKQIPLETNHNAHRILWWFTFGILIIGIAWALVYFLYFQFHESTDDAYVNGNMIQIHSAIPGSIVAFYADDTDLVLEGQLLVELDKTDYLLKYEKSLAELASTTLQVRQIYDNVIAARAVVESKTVALSRARYDYENRSQLVETEAIAKEDYIHSRDDLATAKTAFKQADAQLQAALAAAGNTEIEHHPLLDQAKSNVRQAYYQLKHCSVYAPYTGYVAQRTIDVGQWITPQSPLMAVIPTDYLWVDANFKETQLTYMRVGQPVSVWFDLYGSKVKYNGKVLGIAMGSGSVFSLIPPQNATGNWIKIVQRLPVRISLDPETLKNYPARLGISAEVDVDITNQELPMLTNKPASRPVATTRVFDIHLSEVDKVIDDIIHSNLKKQEL